MINGHELNNFIGTETYYFDPLFRYAKYTDGVKFLRDNGLNWLVVACLANILPLTKTAEYDGFMAIKVRKPTMSVSYEDGNNHVFKADTYTLMDGLDMDKLDLYFMDGVLMLASEY